MALGQASARRVAAFVPARADKPGVGRQRRSYEREDLRAQVHPDGRVRVRPCGRGVLARFHPLHDRASRDVHRQRPPRHRAGLDRDRGQQCSSERRPLAERINTTAVAHIDQCAETGGEVTHDRVRDQPHLHLHDPRRIEAHQLEGLDDEPRRRIRIPPRRGPAPTTRRTTRPTRWRRCTPCPPPPARPPPSSTRHLSHPSPSLDQPSQASHPIEPRWCSRRRYDVERADSDARRTRKLFDTHDARSHRQPVRTSFFQACDHTPLALWPPYFVLTLRHARPKSDPRRFTLSCRCADHAVRGSAGSPVTTFLCGLPRCLGMREHVTSSVT